ncbi:hypothetical protein CYFUS_007073 [Cystobacter fuscus]|uniref:Glyoxalase-like domain-containing protein n=1 Tax=Cystobacter fuscus TaxID=43 RepID=A0A250JEL4_9BACT|nr:VOC family protein [Cystobacter fuscus]ATB41606.1 hypothetical protein CYFUS_007073 [Cystobacter fuscus]
MTRSWTLALACLIVFFGTSAVAAEALRLAHVPIAVRDLDTMASEFARLGFSIKGGRPHANGIENRHVKFPDGTELELITARTREDQLSGDYLDLLAQGEGPAFLALYVSALDPLARWLDTKGIRHETDDGLLSIVRGQPLDDWFFAPLGDGVGLNRSPTDKPEHYRHANGATSLSAVWMAADDFNAERALLRTLGARMDTQTIRAPKSMKAPVAKLQRGQIRFLPKHFQRVPGHRIVGVTLAVPDLAIVERIMRSSDIRNPEVAYSPDRRSLVLPPGEHRLLWIEFSLPQGAFSE